MSSHHASNPHTTGPLVDYYENAEGWKPTGETTLADLIEAIRSPEYADIVRTVRHLSAQGDKKGADALKRKLPAVSISGTVTGRRAKAVQEGRFHHSGLLQIDLDAKDNIGWTIDDMRAELQDDPRMVAVFVTPSGAGVKGIARIPADAERHLAAFLAAEAHFKARNLVIDKACKDPVRLCFVSHDPDAWMRPVDGCEVFQPAELVAVEDLDEEEEEDGRLNLPNGRPQAPSHTISADGGIVIRGGFLPREITPETVREMLSVIPPRPDYAEWLKIASAVWDALGEAEGTAALCAWSPEEKDGEYAAKFPKRLTDVHAGTLVMHAKANGWSPDRETAKAIKEILQSKKVSALVAPPAHDVTETGSTMNQFAPGDIFYDAPGGKYLVRVGKSFLTFNKLSPVKTGLTRYLAPKFQKAAELQLAVTSTILNRELDGAVQWAGSIAGHPQGLALDHNKLPMLITSEANPPRPDASTPDAWNLIEDILGQAFVRKVPDPEKPGETIHDITALNVFISWLAGRYRAVRDHTHIPAPMMVMAGEVNSGKSLIAWLVAQMLGGRTANPYSAWSGGTIWNDDLVGCELLLVDDCSGNTDIRARRNFGAAFKESIYPHIVQLRKRNVSAISVRPVWACMVCCNDTPEALQIIPPLDTDMSDKIAMLHVQPVTLPIDTAKPGGRAELQKMILDELPSFAAALDQWETPAELHDTRSGVKAWRDPDLAEAVEAHSPAKRLESLLETAIENLAIWGDLPRELTAAEVESRLLDHGSTVRDQARNLFSWHGACGSALAKLARIGSSVVQKGRFNERGIQRYFINP